MKTEKSIKGKPTIGKSHNYLQVLSDLERKNDIKIFSTRHKIFILCDQIYSEKKEKYIINPNKKFDLGNKSFGKIDFLITCFYFHIIYVTDFERKTLNAYL